MPVTRTSATRQDDTTPPRGSAVDIPLQLLSEPIDSLVSISNQVTLNQDQQERRKHIIKVSRHLNNTAERECPLTWTFPLIAHAPLTFRVQDQLRVTHIAHYLLRLPTLSLLNDLVILES